MNDSIQFTLNGKPVQLNTDQNRMLLWVLRTDLGLTGTKYGCGESYCGACTVLVNNEAVQSCQTPLKYVQNKTVMTIEGLAKNGSLHPLQQAFMENDALQCGFCTPGMILSAYALLKNNTALSRKDIIDGMENNLCRCGAYNRIIQAIQSAAEQMKGGF
jgi:aerobic-type carbon monoxide dehydrogenase small subunit (CoxS/CutS family)